MAIGIDEIDDFDEEVIVTPNQEENEETSQQQEEEIITQENEENNKNEEDSISAFLKTKGINDLNKIKFENEETGEVEEVSWNDLSKEEQLNILQTSNVDPDRALDDSEIDLINDIRSNGMSVDEYKEMIKQQAISEIQNQEIIPKYEIDQIPDDELYILDLQQKLGDEVTDEELIKALETEKQNPEFFAKKIKGLRQEYKNLEDQQRNLQAEEEKRVYEEQYAQFQQNILEEIRSLNKIGNLDISMELDDMNDIANLILSQDAAGINYLAKELNDPAKLVKVAWFLSKGEQAFNDISDYMAQQIKEISRAQYKKGFEDGKSGKSSTTPKSRVVKPTQTTQKTNTKSNIFTMDDLD